MQKIITTMFSFLKYVLYLAAFGTCLYIMLHMNQRLGKSILDSINVFIPYAVLLILFFVNFIRKHTSVQNNLFFQITCCLVFALIVFVGYRAITDSYLVVKSSFRQNINFNYYADMISPFTVMLYGLSLADLFLVFSHTKPIAVKIEKPKEEKDFPKKEPKKKNKSEKMGKK